MRFLLALRAIFFVLFLPGSVAGYIPLESSALRTRCVFPTWVRPLSAPPSWSSSASSSFFAVSGTSSRRARALSPPSILRASSSWVASIGSRGTHVQRGFRVIVGEAWLFGSVSLIKYGAAGARPLPPFRRALRGARAHITVRRLLQRLPPCCATLGLQDEAISRRHREHRRTCRCSRSLEVAINGDSGSDPPDWRIGRRFATRQCSWGINDSRTRAGTRQPPGPPMSHTQGGRRSAIVPARQTSRGDAGRTHRATPSRSG
jgi:hypothetical protein